MKIWPIEVSLSRPMSIFCMQGYFKRKKIGVNGDRFLDIDTPKHANKKKYPKTCSAHVSEMTASRYEAHLNGYDHQ